jgi:ribosomal protein S18 acetylase RimI-like enzyme
MQKDDDDDQREAAEADPAIQASTEELAPAEGAFLRKKRFELHIREMEIDDLPLVFHMGETIFTAERVPSLYRTWDEYEVASLFLSDPEYCMVAEVDDRIVGFVLGTTVTKARSPWKYGYLVWLGVLPEWQRDGIGSRLFDKVAEPMIEDGVRIFLVDTQADNEPALKFFKKRGFGNPEEHIYLTLNLKTYRQMKKRPRNSVHRQHNENHS